MSVVGKPSPDEVEIVTVRSVEGVKDTATVSKKWWNHVQNARRVRRKLGERYRTTDEVRSLSRAPTKDDRIHDRPRTHVRVYVEDIDAVDTPIPEEADGIEVRTLQYKEGELHDCNRYHKDPLPGGIEGAGDASWCTNDGTWSCRLRDVENGEQYMHRCAHAFDV